ncbi:ArnT family glycosyltransferase [Olivibacter sitiensis]|uniref:ArnT family glycosyltransferase n=1 Tax=Olivibacter sitiensis TaxID=376470 RepID=UPI00041D0B8A|nr:glycosyltransferase family 39 protein [Olivibacter sitiensis]
MTKKNLILAGFLLAKFALQYLLVDPIYELHRDEFLHLDQAHHLAWGYTSVPPVTSWVSSIIYLLGNSVFWVRFFPALFGALTLWLVWKTIEALKGDLFALILGAMAVLFSILLRLNILYQPNSLDVLAWTGFYFMLIKYFQTNRAKWLYMAAGVFAIGFLNKYNILFCLLGLLPALLLLPQRKVFAKKELYLAALVALLLIAPNLWWQYQHDFPVFHHLKELNDTQLVNVHRWDFLKEQVLFFYGSLFVLLAACYALLFYPPFAKYRFLFWSLVFTLFIFTYLRAKSYYAIGLYPIYMAFGSVYIAHLLQSGWRRDLRPVAILLPILLFIPMYQVGFPNRDPEYVIKHADKYKRLGLLRWEDGRDHTLPQDFADMLGWKELAQKVDSVYALFPNKEQTLILCDNYGQAGAINYYTKNKRLRAVSFNADYINWFDFSVRHVNLIRVKNAIGKAEELAETSPYFEHSALAAEVSNPYAREYGTAIFSFIGARIDIHKPIRRDIQEVKERQ